MKPTILAISIATCVCASATAFALQPGDVYSESYSLDGNQYVTVLGGYGIVDESVDHATSSKKDGLDYGLNAGWMFTHNFGAEIGYQQFADATYTGAANSKGTVKDNYNIHLAGVASLPLENNFSIFGKFGIARVHTDQIGIISDATGNNIGSQSKLTAYIAAGGGYNLTPQILISAEIDGTPAANPVPEMYAANAGISYIF